MTPKTCLLPQCRQSPSTRGLCKRHYMQAARTVQRGQSTWPRLDAAGFCLPLQRRRNDCQEPGRARPAARLRIPVHHHAAMKQTTCLLPQCRQSPSTRGLCKRHYKQAGRAVQRGQTTWPRLEAAGFCLPLQRRRNDFEEFAASQINHV